jgi:predicted Zn-dependent protease
MQAVAAQGREAHSRKAMIRRLLACLATTVACLTGGIADAQAPLIAPQEVVLYVHSDLKNTDFVEGLVCELSRVVAAPVRSAAVELPLRADYKASPSQLAPAKLAVPLARATAEDGRGRIFKFLLLPYDLKSGTFNYVFAETYGVPYLISVVSTARVAPADDGRSRKAVSDITLQRVYKLVLKSVARMAGYTKPEGCILAFPRNLAELDSKSSEFCDDDRATLIDAGILKAKPFGACTSVAGIAPVPHADAIALR